MLKNSEVTSWLLLSEQEFHKELSKRNLPLDYRDFQTINGLLLDIRNYIKKHQRERLYLDYTTALIANVIKGVDFRQGKNIRLNGYQHEIGNYLHEILNNCVWASEEATSKLKDFFLECGERAVNWSNPDPNIPRNHKILDRCPRSWLWRIRAGHKALYPPGETTEKKALEEWRNVYRPLPNSFTEQIERSIVDSNVDLHLDRKIAIPKNRAIGSTKACFEKTRRAGGQLSTLWEIFGYKEFDLIFEKDPSEIVESIPKFYDDLFKKCIDLLKRLHSPDKISKCPLGKDGIFGKIRHCDCPHPWLYLFIILVQGGKARIGSCYEAALNYCASIVQKLVTEASRHLITCADLFEVKPGYLQGIQDILKMVKKKKLWFHSGDLKNCTNRFPYETSRTLTKELLLPFKESFNLDLYNYIIDLALGPCRVFIDDSNLAFLRDNAKISNVYKYAQEEAKDQFLCLIGQHLSSPLSFPVMNAMFAYAFAKINPVTIPESFKPDQTRWKRQIQEHMKYASIDKKRYIVIGPHDDGRNFNNNYVEVFLSATWIEKYLSEKGFSFERKELTTISQVEQFFPHLLSDEWNNSFKPEREVEETTEYKFKIDYNIEPPLPEEMNKKKMFQLDQKRNSWAKGKDVMFVIVLTIKGKGLLPNIKYISVAKGETLSIKSEPNTYESMTNLIRVRNGQIRKKFVHRKLWTFSFGDDHLNVSENKINIYEFKRILKEEMNQEFNNKADYISTEGAILAEKCININQERKTVFQEVVIKIKQTLDLEISSTKWIDKIRGIQTYYPLEYQEKFSRSQEEKWYAMRKAVDLLLENNWSYFSQYCKRGINPSLPSKLGGLDYHRSIEDNLLTKKHLQCLAFFWRYSKDLYYLYAKGLRKAMTPTKVILRKKTKEFIARYPGLHRIQYSKVKEIFNNKVSIISSISNRVRTENKTLREMLDLTKSYVEATWNDIYFTYNLAISNNSSRSCRQILRGKMGNFYTYEPSTVVYGKYALKVMEYVEYPQTIDYYEYFIARPSSSFDIKVIFDLEDLSCLKDIPDKAIDDPRYVSLNEKGLHILKTLENFNLESIDESRIKGSFASVQNLTTEQLNPMLMNNYYVPPFHSPDKYIDFAQELAYLKSLGLVHEAD
jgi:hypothetical protein